MFKLLYALLFLLTLLPLRVLYVVSDLIFPLLYHVVRYRRKVVRSNLTNSFPDRSKQEIIHIERKFYHYFCDVFIEAMYRINMSPEEVSRRITFENVELIEKIYAENKSAMLMMAHYGNWEWVSAMSLHLPKESPLYGVYKRLKNAEFDDLTFRLRLKYNMGNIEMRDLFKSMLRMRKTAEKGVFAMVSDQRPPRDNARYSMMFLNQPTAVIVGTEVLARKFDYPVLILSITRPKRGYYHCKVEMLSASPKDEPEFSISEKYMRRLEADINQYPELWLWTHKRWKHKVVL
ncbi:MAG: lysophospholipid acyltransferase family protein [Paludibacter sp.]